MAQINDGKGVFINLMSDFGFKYIFGSTERKHLIIRFLNILFQEDNLHVEDIEFHDKELLPSIEQGKRILYDVYCTINHHEKHVILEMQKMYHQFFENRSIYYAARAIASQGLRGWNYELSPVYTIFLVDFMFNHMDQRLVHDIRLLDTISHEPYSDALRLVFLHLNEVKSDWDKCETECDKILFIIKNMYNMDKDSKAYKSGEFYDFFNESEVQSLAAEDLVAYSQSNLKYWEDQMALDYAIEKSSKEAEERGLAKGRTEGLAEGRTYTNIANARKMKDLGLGVDTIAQVTGLSPEEIERL